MEASVLVILSIRAAYEARKEAVVDENVRTVSMRARKSLAERVMYCGGCVELLEQWPVELKRPEGALVKLGWMPLNVLSYRGQVPIRTIIIWFILV